MNEAKIACHYCGEILRAKISDIIDVRGEPHYMCRIAGEYRSIVFLYPQQKIAWKNLKVK